MVWSFLLWFIIRAIWQQPDSSEQELLVSVPGCSFVLAILCWSLAASTLFNSAQCNRSSPLGHSMSLVTFQLTLKPLCRKRLCFLGLWKMSSSSISLNIFHSMNAYSLDKGSVLAIFPAYPGVYESRSSISLNFQITSAELAIEKGKTKYQILILSLDPFTALLMFPA